MAVRVVRSDGDHRQTGTAAVEQRTEPGVVRAVMGHLQHLDRPWVDWHRLGLGVSG